MSAVFPSFGKQSTVTVKDILLSLVVMELATASVTILWSNVSGSDRKFSLINEESTGKVKPMSVLLTQLYSTVAFIAFISLLYKQENTVKMSLYNRDFAWSD